MVVASGRMKPAAPALLVAAAALLLRLFLLGAPQMDWDEGVYWQSLRALTAGHPLFASIYSSQPPAFLLLLEPWYRLFGGGIAAARAAVLLYSLAGWAGAYVAAERLAGKGTGVVAVAALVIPSILVRESLQLQAEGPSLGLALGALALAAWHRPERRRGGLALLGGAGLLAATAVMTKLLALPVLAALLAVALQGGDRWPRLAALAAGFAAGVLAWLLPVLSALPQAYEQVVGFHLAARTVPAGDPRGVALGLAGLAPLLFAGAVGLVVAWRDGARLAVPLLAWLAVAALLLAVQRPLWPHHLAGIAVPAALAAGPLGRLLPSDDIARRFALGLALMGCLAGALAFAASIPGDGSQRAAAAELARRVPPAELVITDDQYTVALAGRDVPPGLVDTSQVRIESGDLTGDELLTAAADPQVGAILDGTGRLRLLPALPVAIAGFPTREELPGGRNLLVR